MGNEEETSDFTQPLEGSPFAIKNVYSFLQKVLPSVILLKIK